MFKRISSDLDHRLELYDRDETFYADNAYGDACMFAAEIRTLRQTVAKLEVARENQHHVKERDELKAELNRLRERYPEAPQGMRVRAAARQRYALGGADAQALEGALQQADAEVAKLKEALKLRCP